jgi:alpha-mannosidase
MKTKRHIEKIENFEKQIAGIILVDSVPFEAKYFHSVEPVPYGNRLDGKYKPIGEGDTWGHNWESAWFQLKGIVPQGWKGGKIVAQLDFSGEGLVYSAAGDMLQGITNGSVFDQEFGRDIVHLYDPCEGEEEIELWIETAANGLFGMFTAPDPEPNSPQRYGYYDAKVNSMRLCLFDKDLWHFLLDLKILMGFLKTLPQNNARLKRLGKATSEMIKVYARNRDKLNECRRILQRELYQPADEAELNVLATGHAHIDIAWLWPVSETIRKCARTFSSQLALIEKYRDYIFGASQPQEYVFVRDNYPELYERIKEAVRQGRWEPLGGMWVEPDCNLISGESMIRQILHGKNFFRDEFGIDVQNLWLPDVFGYSGSMPQILKKSGIKYFLSQKLSWNQYNEFPYHTFKWKGIDGSEVLAHFPPENTYNSQLGTDYLIPGRDNFREKDFISEFISLFGVGDGGGGPKEENIELGIRMADLKGAPKVRFGKAADFFERIAKYEDQLKTWEGELYFELHRGTYTTQAYVKKANRKLECELKALEFLFSCLPLSEYPGGQLDAVWKTVMLNQFHDILPGSSITKVYEVARKEYAGAFQKCEHLRRTAASKMFEEDDNCLVLFNCLHYPYDMPIKLPASWTGHGVKDQSGNVLHTQLVDERTLVQINVKPYSFFTLHKAETENIIVTMENDLVLENNLVKYEFAEDGTLLYAYDKTENRTILAEDELGNLFTLYEDRPKNWDAWDIDITYEDHALENARMLERTILPAGNVQMGLRFVLAIGKSKIRQDIVLARNSKRLDFRTFMDWRENHKMLRVAFPVDIISAQASFDIQYGFIKRNTHRKTSWDMAKFEVVGQRYADLSDDDYGVALLNDCKYGYKILGNVIDLNLLRSPTYPDPDADRGEHEFTYSLLPHSGNLPDSDVIPQAAQLNQGLMLFEGFRSMLRKMPCHIEGEGLSLETVKKAEKEDCLILRIVETLGRDSKGRLVIDNPFAKIVETDLMEWTEGESHPGGKPIELSLKPFEIISFKLKD